MDALGTGTDRGVGGAGRAGVAANPREISSRSASDNRNRERTGSGFGTRLSRNT